MRKNESSGASNESVANVCPNAIILFFLALLARDTYEDSCSSKFHKNYNTQDGNKHCNKCCSVRNVKSNYLKCMASQWRTEAEKVKSIC